MKHFSCAVLAAIAHRAESNPGSLALTNAGSGSSLTYQELWKTIETITMRLHQEEIASGQRVAILLPAGMLQFIAVAGVLNRHVGIPLQSKTTKEEVESLLRKLRVTCLIVSPQCVAEIDAALKMGIKILIARDDAPPEDWEVRSAACAPQSQPEPSQALLLFATSATTGAAKIVPISAGNLDSAAVSNCAALHLTDRDRLLLMISLCHRNGVESAFAQLLVGGEVAVTSGFDPANYLHWLDELQPTWYICSPAVHKAALAQLAGQPPRSAAALCFVQSSGAPLPEATKFQLENMLRAPVLNAYGATEAHHIAMEPFPPQDRRPESVGRSCGLEIGILHDSGELLPAGEEGEIVVRGPAVFAGYEDDAEANRRAFQNGWFRTGDLGRLDEHGNLYVTGRLKEMINRGGEKILPGEVDAVLLSHPEVLDAAAFAVPHPTLGEDVACAVVLRDGALPSAADIRRFTSQYLASFKVPRHIHFVGEIPKGELGKPQRWLLAERLGQEESTPSDPAETWNQGLPYVTNDLRYKIREIWGRILDRDDVSLREDFFEAGGDSLAAINMLAEVDQRFGSKTSDFAARFLDEPTIEILADLVGTPVFPMPDYCASNDMQLFPIRAKGTDRRIYLVPADEDEGLYFRRLAKHLEGIIDVTIVRPASTFYSRSLFTFESAAAEMTKLIVQEQPKGPYLVGGYCFGGAVAFEAARQLASDNHQVRLVLFDVPMPGYPGFLNYVTSESRSALRKLLNGRESKPGASPDPIAEAKAPLSAPPAAMARRMRQIAKSRSRMFLWYAISRARQSLRPVEKYRLMQRLLKASTQEYFPVYRGRPIDVPILHFLCADEPDVFTASSRLGWRKVAGQGIEERSVPQNHMNALHESSLPAIVDAIRTWCGI